jgi:hypothetical protein
MTHDLLEIVKPKEKVSPGFAKPAWKPPPVGWVKCNTDGAYRPDWLKNVIPIFPNE